MDQWLEACTASEVGFPAPLSNNSQLFLTPVLEGSDAAGLGASTL